MTRRAPAQFVSLALALLMTLGMLRGVDHLAVFEAAQATQAAALQQTAQAGTPATPHRARHA